MSFSRTNIVLAVLLMVVALLAAMIEVDHSRPNLEFLPEMKRSPASDAYSFNAVFAAGRTLQPPVAGTIARGELPLHFQATKEEAVRAGEELLNPYTIAQPASTSMSQSKEQPANDKDAVDNQENTGPAKKPDDSKDADAAEKQSGQQDKKKSREAERLQRLQASIQRGNQIYSVSCTPCHGSKGAGDGPVAKRGFPPPPPLTTGKSVQMKDGQLFHILTYGQGSMAPMAAQLTRDRRWDVINSVRNLQQDAARSAQQAADASTSATPSPAGGADNAERSSEAEEKK